MIDFVALSAQLATPDTNQLFGTQERACMNSLSESYAHHIETHHGKIWWELDQDNILSYCGA